MKFVEEIRKEVNFGNILPILFFVVGVLACLILSLQYLNYVGLWTDELMSVFFADADKGIFSLLPTMMVDPSPPLYYILLHFWMVIFSENEFWVRGFSYFIGCLGLLGAFWAGRRIFDLPRGVALAGLFALTPAFVTYLPEARGYILNMSLTMPFMAFAIIIARDILAGEKLQKFDVRGFALLGFLLAFTHHYGLFLYASLGLSLLVMAHKKESESEGYLLKLIIISALVYLPWGIISVLILPLIKSVSSWQSDDVTTIIYPYMRDLGGNISFVFGVFGGLFILAVARHGLRLCKNPLFFLPVIATFSVFIIVAILSKLVSPMVAERYFIGLIPIHLILLVFLAERALAYRGLFLWGLAIFAAVSGYYAYDKLDRGRYNDFRTMAEYITDLPNCDEADLILLSNLRVPDETMGYYLPKDVFDLSVVETGGEYDEAIARIDVQSCPAVVWSVKMDEGDMMGYLSGIGLDVDRYEQVEIAGTILFFDPLKMEAIEEEEN